MNAMYVRCFFLENAGFVILVLLNFLYLNKDINLV